MEVTIHEYRTVKLTRLAVALLESLESAGIAVATDYQLYQKFRALFEHPEGLYLRGSTPTIPAYRRTRNLLVNAKKIIRDTDYFGAYRLLSAQDLPADEISCALDSFCYISHISAMQRYGLTDRRPEALHLTIPALKILKPMLIKKMAEDYGEGFEKLDKKEVHPLHIVHHPPVVRKRKIETFSTIHYGQSLIVKGTQARVSTIGQTFLDMLETPDLCGGMSHVLQVWQEHAKAHLQHIIPSINNAPKSIHKVRAGYILGEKMNIQSTAVDEWLVFAQRGGSRILDPSKPFANRFSERWMLSLNVE